MESQGLLPVRGTLKPAVAMLFGATILVAALLTHGSGVLLWNAVSTSVTTMARPIASSTPSRFQGKALVVMHDNVPLDRPVLNSGPVATLGSSTADIMEHKFPVALPLLSVICGAILAIIVKTIGKVRSRHSVDVLSPLHTEVAFRAVSVAASLGNGQGGLHYGDDTTERKRLEQRVVFDLQRWRRHRSATRYLRALPSFSISAVMRQTFKPVLAIMVFNFALCAAHAFLGFTIPQLPTSLFALSGPTLGLLLVFRTNASYERWDGARKMIGLVKNRSEDLVRQTCFRFPEERADLKEKMLRYIQAFFFALKVHLRCGPGGLEDDNTLINDLTPILTPTDLKAVLQSKNRPAYLLQCMTAVIRAASLDGAALITVDRNLTDLEDVVGGCERILRTPIPLSYTRMTTRFVMLWLVLLPFALSVEIIKLGCSPWVAPGCVAFVAFLLLGVDEVAVQIEEPFSILPLEAYAEGSRKNTEVLFQQSTGIAALLP